MSNSIFNNTVLANKYESILSTKLNMNQFMTIDNDLQAQPGMTKKVITKTATGSVDKLTQGNGNSHFVEVATSTNDYTVETVQGQFIYYDEEAMADPAVVDAGLNGLAEKMMNSFVSDAIAEFDKATLQQGYAKSSGIAFNDVVDALAKLNMEDETSLFMLISPNSVAAFRKNLKDDLKYAEAFVRTGYIGSVCGVPCYISKAIADGVAFIASKEAITDFVKKGSVIEQDRDVDLRKNLIVARKVAVVALTDARKVVKIAPNQATDATVTTYTKNAKTVAGAATTGATVYVYINGVLDGTATASSSAYSYTAKANLAPGDEVYVIAKLAGHVDNKSTTVEVAA